MSYDSISIRITSWSSFDRTKRFRTGWDTLSSSKSDTNDIECLTSPLASLNLSNRTRYSLKKLFRFLDLFPFCLCAKSKSAHPFLKNGHQSRFFNVVQNSFNSHKKLICTLEHLILYQSFNFSNRKKSDGIRSGEYDGCGSFFISFALRKSNNHCVVCGRALSVWTINLRKFLIALVVLYSMICLNISIV
jgi:hypothetical protein